MHVGYHVADINSTISSCILISNNEMEECYIEKLKFDILCNETSMNIIKVSKRLSYLYFNTLLQSFYVYLNIRWKKIGKPLSSIFLPFLAFRRKMLGSSPMHTKDMKEEVSF